ncbi:FtsW/RodA/SpoVE family cell cycle protein [Marinilongibacter aquaticus]|uniref:FtsW/RodA/SpoVE family cell cycle protein n=1 Tax=Marinilongibacter aquaticus TaxID=2975157 RepID=UPI0021BD8D24|nr:FtsW/RodA/SpoVE family cell cycle protein [Marinilongibacter aquaticus]UBM57254.1 FtsW/RodA/SpoVE family cell cycle protein [Marinilongibacter aquaticus]
MSTFKIKDHLKGDPQIWFITLLLSCFGIAAVYSSVSALAYRSSMSSEAYMFRQLSFVLVGLGITYVVHRFNFLNFAPLAKVLLWLSPLILVYTLTFGHSVGGAKRWISVMGWTFQTSDLIRLVLITNLAAMLARKQNAMDKFKNLWPIIIWSGILCGLLAISSFSTSVILGVTCFMLMIIGRVPRKYIFRMVASVFIGLCLTFLAGLFSKAVLHKSFGRTETVINRTESFLNIDLDGNELIGGELGSVSEQQDQALAAIARGGLVGVGPGRSAVKNKLAEAYSDFIYSIIIEEYGLLGGIVVMFTYLWLLARGLKNIDQTKQAFGGLLSIGLTLSIVFQAFAHMFINVGLGPVTGQTLPLISKGGTSILFTFVAIGIVLSVSKNEEIAPSVTKSK